MPGRTKDRVILFSSDISVHWGQMFEKVTNGAEETARSGESAWPCEHEDKFRFPARRLKQIAVVCMGL